MISSASPLFRPVDAHAHLDTEVCPWCEQSITHDKLEEISARIAEEEKARLAKQEAALRDQFALERDQTGAKAQADLAAAKNEADEALARMMEQAKAAAAAQAEDEERKLASAVLRGKAEVEAANAEKLRTADACVAKASEEKRAAEFRLKNNEESFSVRIAEAEQKRKADVAAAMSTTEVAVAARMMASVDEANARAAAANAEKSELEKDAAEKLAAAEAARAAADRKVESLNAAHATELIDRTHEVREALGREKTQALLAEQAKAFAERQKFNETVQDLQRQLEKKSAAELGEGAEIDLFEVLKEAFEGDRFRRVSKGENGADIVHEIVEHGKTCGTIVYDSKNRNAWQSKFSTKLHTDMIAAKADHAILSTNKFPAGGRQLQMLNGVILACPARVVSIAKLLRAHIVQTHTLRLSTEQRDEKTAALYGYITSERCWQLLDSVQTSVEKLEAIDVAEKKAHDAVWEKRGRLLKEVEKTRGTFVHELNRIIGTAEAE